MTTTETANAITKIINLTPHSVSIVPCEGHITTFPPSGIVARCATKSEPVSTIETETGEIPLVKTVIGEPENIPEPENGTLYIVSRLVKSALPERDDLIVPDGLVRDTEGNVLGA